jgi:hypothetical protein
MIDHAAGTVFRLVNTQLQSVGGTADEDLLEPFNGIDILDSVAD